MLKNMANSYEYFFWSTVYKYNVDNVILI